MKRIAVDFSGNIPRVLTGYTGPSTDKIIANPALGLVKKIPPHCWYLVDGKIIPGEPRDLTQKNNGFAGDTDCPAIKNISTKKARQPIESACEPPIKEALFWYKLATVVNLLSVVVIFFMQQKEQITGWFFSE
jgi:hypothetical protein